MSAGYPSQLVFRGFVSGLKDDYGFIETLSHDQEIFFHYNHYHGNPRRLEWGQEVEYTLSPNSNGDSVSGKCVSARKVRTLPKGSIPQPYVLDKVNNGVVARPLRCIDPDQGKYAGLIDALNETRNQVLLSHYEFGAISLVNRRDILQKGDLVTFKIDETGRAAEINPLRPKERATVDTVKRQFGFLKYKMENGRKLFFHMSEVQGNDVSLHPGDTVEFTVITNQRNGKSQACNVFKIDERCPDRLIPRLSVTDDTMPRITVIRAPKGPHGTGFSAQTRLPRTPGVFVE